MNGGKVGQVKALSGEYTLGYLGFSPNGTSDPDATYTTGPMKRWVTSITYSATGGYVIVFNPGFVFANNQVAFIVSSQQQNVANYFVAVQEGSYNATTRTLTVRTMQGNAGAAIAASSGAAMVWIALNAKDTTAT